MVFKLAQEAYMLGIFGSFNKVLYTAGSVLLVILIVVICSLKYRCIELTSQINLLQAESVATKQSLENAKANLEAKDKQIELIKTSQASSNELLKKCYDSKSTEEEEFQQVEENMNAKDDTLIEQKETNYEKITDKQNETGLEYINNILNAAQLQ